VNAEELDGTIAGSLDELRRELAGRVAPERVTAIGYRHYERLRRDATINDFIPVLVHRYAREELLRIAPDELHGAA
jgi:hypothetical protein